MALEVNDGNFDEIVIKSDKPVMVDFWAEWCGPCRVIAPYIEEIGKEYEGRAVVAKCDVDSSPGVAARFGIRNIPTVLFFKGSKYMSANFKKFLCGIHSLPVNDQKGKLEAEIVRWKGELPQVDDILVIGTRIT